jgi:hypothetical protein
MTLSDWAKSLGILAEYPGDLRIDQDDTLLHVTFGRNVTLTEWDYHRLLALGWETGIERRLWRHGND